MTASPNHPAARDRRTQPLSALVTPALEEKAKRLAKERGISVSELINRLLRRAR